jgi:hypothetical protein
MPNTPAGARITGTMLSLNYKNADIGSVTVTAATPTDLTGTFSIPGGDALVGNEYEVEAWGNGIQGATPQILTFQGVFAGQNLVTVQIGTNVLPASLIFRWHIHIRMICLSIGATGTFQSLNFGEISTFNQQLNYSGNPSTGFAECEATGNYVVDTTASQGLKLQASWAATTSAPTITKTIAMQRKIGVG